MGKKAGKVPSTRGGFLRKLVRLDIKDGWIIKGMRLEGYRKICRLEDALDRIHLMSDIEVILFGVVDALFGTKDAISRVPEFVSRLRLPLCVGGGVSSTEDVDRVFGEGADRILLNSALIKFPNVIEYAMTHYGAQAVVGHMQVYKYQSDYRLMRWAGREELGISVESYLMLVKDVGIKEVHISSVNDDGMLCGWSLQPLLERVLNTGLEVTVSGGFSSYEEQFSGNRPHGIALAAAFYRDNGFEGRNFV